MHALAGYSEVKERLLRDGGLSGTPWTSEGKVCVITGAGGGMGADAAQLFSEKGRRSASPT